MAITASSRLPADRRHGAASPAASGPRRSWLPAATAHEGRQWRRIASRTRGSVTSARRAATAGFSRAVDRAHGHHVTRNGLRGDLPSPALSGSGTGGRRPASWLPASQPSRHDFGFPGSSRGPAPSLASQTLSVCTAQTILTTGLGPGSGSPTAERATSANYASELRRSVGLSRSDAARQPSYRDRAAAVR